MICDRLDHFAKCLLFGYILTKLYDNPDFNYYYHRNLFFMHHFIFNSQQLNLGYFFQMTILCCLLYVAVSIVILIAFTLLFLRLWLKVRRRNYRASVGGRCVLGFFHPYCNAGGGGERVLWVAIRAIQKK